MNQPESGGYDPNLARILLVDDEPANLKLFGLMLRAEGYRHIVPIQDPRQVANACSIDPPDLMLLDINMPHLDGFGVMSALQEAGNPIPFPSSC